MEFLSDSVVLLYQAFSLGPPTSSQIMTQRLISFECLA